MRFQALVKVMHAHAGVDNGQHDEKQGDHRKERQGRSSWKILLEPSWLVHPDQLKQEICHRREIEQLIRVSSGPCAR